MKTLANLVLSTWVLVMVATTTPAHASNGVFDALDPCIKQTDEFRDQRVAYLELLDQDVRDAATAPVPAAYRDAWMKGKRAQMRAAFDKYIVPALQDAGVKNLDEAYVNWFDNYFKKLGAPKTDELVTVNFHRELQEARVGQRAKGLSEEKAAQDDLDNSCKMDVGNQMLRGTLNAALAPIDMVSRNWEVAKKESGVGAQALAAATGISFDAINQNGGVFGGGLSGGENSVFRKNFGIRF